MTIRSLEIISTGDGNIRNALLVADLLVLGKDDHIELHRLSDNTRAGVAVPDREYPCDSGVYCVGMPFLAWVHEELIRVKKG